MLFSEKMSRVPQPHRAELWKHYRTLCTALVLKVRTAKAGRRPTEEEIFPLKTAAEKANGILAQFGMEPSFYPEAQDFFPRLTAELEAVMNAPSAKD